MGMDGENMVNILGLDNDRSAISTSGPCRKQHSTSAAIFFSQQQHGGLRGEGVTAPD